MFLRVLEADYLVMPAVHEISCRKAMVKGQDFVVCTTCFIAGLKVWVQVEGDFVSTPYYCTPGLKNTLVKPYKLRLKPSPVRPQVPCSRIALEMRGDEYLEIEGYKGQV